MTVWQTSNGAVWHTTQCPKLGAAIIDGAIVEETTPDEATGPQCQFCQQVTAGQEGPQGIPLPEYEDAETVYIGHWRTGSSIYHTDVECHDFPTAPSPRRRERLSDRFRECKYCAGTAESPTDQDSTLREVLEREDVTNLYEAQLALNEQREGSA